MLFAWQGISFSQTKPSLEIFDKLISERIEEIFYLPDLDRSSQFVFKIHSNSNKEDEVKFLTSVLKKTSDRLKLRAAFSKEMAAQDSLYNAVWIDIRELGVRYPGFKTNRFLGEKSVKRNLFGNIRVEISAVHPFYNLQDSILVSYSDEVDYKEIENIESADYSFTHSKAPKVSTFEEIIFPAAIIAVTALAAVLFFTIRSK
jgi:hypothetical protein